MVDTNLEYTKYMKKQFLELGTKSTCNVSLRIYTRNTASLLFSCRFSEVLRKPSGCFSQTEYLQKAENQGSVPVSEMCLWLVFFEFYEETWSRLHMVYTKIRITRFL